jgi:hypothetical protein
MVNNGRKSPVNTMSVSLCPGSVMNQGKCVGVQRAASRSSFPFLVVYLGEGEHCLRGAGDGAVVHVDERVV